LHRLKGKVWVINLARDGEHERDMIESLLKNPLVAPDFRPMSRDEIYQDRVKGLE
jgi:hypothetical protein